MLDSSFSGVLVSDFYAAYNHYPGLKQRCWAHLLRDIHDLKGLYPEDAGLAQWAEAVHQVYTEAKASVLPRAQPGHRTQLMLEEKLMVLARPFLKASGGSGQALPAHGTVHQGTVCLRVGPSRALRQQRRRAEPAASGNQSQDQRGGTRSGQGTDSKMTLASLFGTWRARGLNPLLECRRLLASPQI